MSDYETVRAKRDWIVGLFVVLGLIAFAWLVFRFGDLPSGVARLRSYDVYAQFASAPGVQQDTPVRFCGYQVGRVTEVRPPRRLPEIRSGARTGPEYHQTVVVMSIQSEYTDLPADARVRLMTRGFGSSYIDIQPPPADPCAPAQGVLQEGAWIQGSMGVTSELFPEQTQKKLEDLLDDLSEFFGHANGLVGDPNMQRDIRTTLANLSESSKRIGQVMERAEQALQRATEAVEEYRALAVAGKDTLRNADAKVDQLAVAIVQTSEELGQAASQMRQVVEKVNAGQGTLGRLVNDGRFYEDLLETTQQLQVFAEKLTLIVEKLDQKGLRGVWKGSGKAP